MKRMMTLLLAAVMMVSLLTVGAGASTTYSETVDGITYTLDNVIDQKELVVKFDDYDFGASRSNPYEKTVTVCQIVANKSTMTVTNNSADAIYPGEVTYGIFGEGYIVDNGGQMCDEVAPGSSGSWTIGAYSHVEELPFYMEICLVKDPDLLLFRAEGSNFFYTTGDLSKIGTEVKSDGNPFTDISEDDYFYAPVLWALENKVTTGATTTTFAPYNTCTRGQVVTFLWRAKGCPAPTSDNNPFTDVKRSDYYYDAVLWAVEQGITTGTTTTTFSPNQKCTNGHVVTFLWRAEGEPEAVGYSVMGNEEFAGSWYSDAISWADTTGLLEIPGEGFQPAADSPRARIVTYLYRNIAE